MPSRWGQRRRARGGGGGGPAGGELGKAIAAGQDLRQPMGEIADEWVALVRERFDQEKDPLGVPWAPRYGNADPERKLLHLTGALERAVVPDFGSDYAQVGVLKSGGPGVYARVHNEGGTIVPRHKAALSFGGRLVARVVMPRRQYLGFGPGEQVAVADVLGDFLRGMFSGPAQGGRV